MTRTLLGASPALILLFLAFFSLALTPPAPMPQILTPVVTLPVVIGPTPGADTLQNATPAKIKPASVPLVKQAGNSDRIVLIGILIFGIIAVPILLQRKEWLGN
jgi:hypothetical protein